MASIAALGILRLGSPLWEADSKMIGVVGVVVEDDEGIASDFSNKDEKDFFEEDDRVAGP